MKDMISRIAFAAALASIPVAAHAQQADDAIVVTATRAPTNIANVGVAISVIDAQDMLRQQTQFAPDVLQTLPGVAFNQNGPRGSVSSFRLRGEQAYNTLVLIDGMEPSDPSAPQTTFDFSQLLSIGIDRIEVLRGAQSVLYGSEAVGGVVNITTRRGAGDAHGAMFAEGGSYSTDNVGGRVTGGLLNDRVGYSADFQRFETGGFSALDENYPGVTEGEGYNNFTASTRLDFDLTDAVTLRAIGRYAVGTSNEDGFASTPPFGLVDDPGPRTDFKQYAGRVSADVRLWDGFFTGAAGAAYSRNDRDSQYFATPTFSFLGDRTKYDFQGNLNFSAADILVFGAETEEERYRSSSDTEKSSRTDSVYANYQVGFFDRLYLTIGARLDDNDTYGDFDSYRGSLSYLLGGGLRFKASYATGFRAPSLYERFGTDGFGDIYGNPNLQPEKSKSWDSGFEFSTRDRTLVADIAYFQIETDDAINFVFDFTRPPSLPDYYNVAGTTTSRGVETSVSWRITPALSASFAYTYNDVNASTALAYRPRHVTNLNLNYVFANDRANLNLNVRGEADIRRAATLPMEDYVVANLAASYNLTDSLQVYGRVENLTDEQYQSIYQYGTADRSAYLGLRLIY